MKNTITKATRLSDIQRTWHLIDAAGEVLGRVASGIAVKLMGKYKPNFVRNLDCGDNVVVLNASHVVTTGKKEKEKIYSHYSGYPGGRKAKALWQIRQKNPAEIIRHAVWGMLPNNKLRDRLVTRLYIYPEKEHPYKDKFTKEKS
jgi:large subunit ribosomal protein L13